MEVIFWTVIILFVGGWWANFIWQVVTENCGAEEAEEKFFGVYGIALIVALIGIGQLL